ncbi:hypothetical protein Brsp05_04499 [Brucella sp. NBRC 12953]
MVSVDAAAPRLRSATVSNAAGDHATMMHALRVQRLPVRPGAAAAELEPTYALRGKFLQ